MYCMQWQIATPGPIRACVGSHMEGLVKLPGIKLLTEALRLMTEKSLAI